MTSFIYGVNPVRELLRRRPGDVKQILVGRKEQGLEQVIAAAQKAGASVTMVNRNELDSMTNSREHQGIAAEAPLPRTAAIEDVLQKTARNPQALVVMLDQIEDPQNLGAIIRSAECSGADCVVIPEHRSAGVTPAVLKASAGALEWIPLVVVTNLTRVLEQVKEAGFWSYAATASARESIWQTKFSEKSALVIGSEGKGIRPLVLKNCDFQVAISLYGKIQSLNASVSSAIILYEFRRQIQAK